MRIAIGLYLPENSTTKKTPKTTYVFSPPMAMDVLAWKDRKASYLVKQTLEFLFGPLW